MYRREEFERQFIFLKEQVVDRGAIGWILGSPGTGKSSTAMAFISTLDKNEWVVTWLHLHREFGPVCLRFDGSWKYSLELDDLNMMGRILEQFCGIRKHIVFVDGFFRGGKKHGTISTICHNWVRKDRHNRRLVLLCSMTSSGKNTVDEDAINNIQRHCVYAWSLREFLEAVKIREIFEQVERFLDSHMESRHASSSREEMVTSKFHFAGGSCRMMFSYTTSEIIEQLHDAVQRASNIVDHILGRVGDQADQGVNRLFIRYLNEISEPKTAIVSRYASILLAEAIGPDLVRHIYDSIRGEMNPAMDGWIFEMFFFAKLKMGGVVLYDSPEQGQVPTIQWEEARTILRLDPSNPSALTISPASRIWMRPVKWNQGGYDAIFWSNNTVTFVQVTRGTTHSFKLEFFSHVLNAFANSIAPRIEAVDVFFVVPRDIVSTFRVSNVSGHGLLQRYRTSKGTRWGNSNEQLHVQIVGVVAVSS